MTKISKYMSCILRHQPELIGITIEKKGAWANTDELIKGISKKYPIDRNILEEIVANDDKQRYSFNADKTKIRANQGHTIDVEIDFPQLPPPQILYHGTTVKNVDSILRTGINKGKRLYVHLSQDIPTAEKVGARHGKPVIFTVSAQEMYNDGYVFYLSDNGVWLTDFVPTKYISPILQYGQYSSGGDTL